MIYAGIYLLIAVFAAICHGVTVAIVEHGKLDLNDTIISLVIGILWPIEVIALGFVGIGFGIGFLFKILCEKIARLIMCWKTLDSGDDH